MLMTCSTSVPLGTDSPTNPLSETPGEDPGAVYHRFSGAGTTRKRPTAGASVEPGRVRREIFEAVLALSFEGNSGGAR